MTDHSFIGYLCTYSVMEDLLDCFLSCDLQRLKTLLKTIGINGRVSGTDGFTPLHVFAGIETVNDKEKILSYLLDNGADPNARSDENLTPVHIAAMWDRCYQLEELIKHKGNPWLTDDENKNSFDMACDNQCYKATKLLHDYLSRGELDLEPKKKESKKLKFETPDIFSTPSCFDSSQTDNLNNSLNLTFMTAKESKFMSPATFTPPLYLENSETENLNESANYTFMSAKENFPLIFSSNDESGDYSSDASVFLKKLNITENEQCVKVKENDFSDTQQDECTPSTIILNEKKISESEKYKNNLNKAYIFSSSSDTSDATTSDLNEFDDEYRTIVDCNDNTVILIETKNNDISFYSSIASICDVPNDWKSYHNITSDCTALSYCCSHSKSSLNVPDELQEYSNSKIFLELKSIGDNPGPVLDHTRHVYLHRLAKLRSGCAISCDLPKPKYCPEVYLFLENKLDMDRAVYLEENIREEFDAETSREWREGNQRCCFNYFLLDPRVTLNLPQRAKQLTTEQTFSVFLDALFYVGKGTKGRPYSHLFEAAKSIKDERPRSDKVNHILDIWNAEGNLGVISLHCFHHSIPVEAYTREACIIEAVGLDNLTNIRKGDYYGLCAKLTSSRKRLIGISLLYKALQIFLQEGERFITPKDIIKK